MKQNLKRTIVVIGMGLFSGLSILNMQPYFSLAEVAYGLIKFLPFVWFLNMQMVPILLAVMAACAFLLHRGKKFNPFLAAGMRISILFLIILSFKSMELSISVFGVLLWGTSTLCQTAPFWLKSFFFDGVIGAFRSHKTEASVSSDNEATKTLIEKRNNLPQEILRVVTTGALVANGIDILLGIWQYPLISWANLFSLSFSPETVAIDAVIKVLLLSVLPEVVLLITARYLYLCSIDVEKNGGSRRQEKRQGFSGGSDGDQNSRNQNSRTQNSRTQRRNDSETNPFVL